LIVTPFLPKVNSRSRSLYIIARPSVCLSSVTLVRHTQAVVVFGNFSTAFLVPWPSIDMHRKFYGDGPRGTPPSGELNPRGVAEYSDFGPVEGRNVVQSF